MENLNNLKALTFPMRRFQTTPRKKLVGMLILFVFIPLFLLWYWVFFLGNRPGIDTIVIIACVAVLAAYFYLRYKKQINALAEGQAAEPEPEETAPTAEEEFEQEPEEPAEEEPEEPAEPEEKQK